MSAAGAYLLRPLLPSAALPQPSLAWAFLSRGSMLSSLPSCPPGPDLLTYSMRFKRIMRCPEFLSILITSVLQSQASPYTLLDNVPRIGPSQPGRQECSHFTDGETVAQTSPKAGQGTYQASVGVRFKPRLPGAHPMLINHIITITVQV